MGEWFDVSPLQGFSSDVYYKAFLSELAEAGLYYEELGKEPLGTPDIVIP